MKANTDLHSKNAMVSRNSWSWVLWIFFAREILVSNERIPGGRRSGMLVRIILVGESIISSTLVSLPLASRMPLFIPILWGLIIALYDSFCLSIARSIATHILGAIFPLFSLCSLSSLSEKIPISSVTRSKINPQRSILTLFSRSTRKRKHSSKKSSDSVLVGMSSLLL